MASAAPSRFLPRPARAGWALLLLMGTGCAGDEPARPVRQSSAGIAVAAPVRPVTSPARSLATCGLPEFRQAALARVNRVRAAGASCGGAGRFGPARALAWNDTLAAVSSAHSRDMAAKNYFSHTARDGRTQRQRIEAAGYDWGSIGENIDAGSTTVNEAVDRWMASDVHCANIMNPGFSEMGLACEHGGSGNTYRTYWTMTLGRQR